MTVEILEQVYPQVGSRLLRAVLQVIQDDLGAEQQREFITVLGTIESVLKDTSAKLRDGETKLLTDLHAFEGTVRDYLREMCRRIVERNSGKDSSREN